MVIPCHGAMITLDQDHSFPAITSKEIQQTMTTPLLSPKPR